MYEMFDKATGFVLDYYSKDGKNKSCLCTFRKYLNKLRAYLVSESIAVPGIFSTKCHIFRESVLRYRVHFPQKHTFSVEVET